MVHLIQIDMLSLTIGDLFDVSQACCHGPEYTERGGGGGLAAPRPTDSLPASPAGRSAVGFRIQRISGGWESGRANLIEAIHCAGRRATRLTRILEL